MTGNVATGRLRLNLTPTPSRGGGRGWGVMCNMRSLHAHTTVRASFLEHRRVGTPPLPYPSPTRGEGARVLVRVAM
jgi:hypothetical protein